MRQAEKDAQRSQVVALLVEDQQRTQLDESEERYILSLDWFKKWESFTANDGEPYCGKISNGSVFERDMLKTGTERVVLKKDL
jgi:hypothetical protein